MANENQKQEKEIPIEIQAHQISNEALDGVIQNFILREGTDYGVVEIDYNKKKEQIQKQIDHGHVKIIFDQSSETVSLITAQDFQKLKKKVSL